MSASLAMLIESNVLIIMTMITVAFINLTMSVITADFFHSLDGGSGKCGLTVDR